MPSTRPVVLAAVAGALLTLALMAWLPVVQWGPTLLVIWAALAAGLACRSAWRRGAARWSWRVGSGLLRAGRGVEREAGSPVAARAAVGQVVRAGAVLAGDRGALVERCRRLSPRARAALLLVVVLVALLAVSAGLVVATVWCVRHLRAGWRRATATTDRVLRRLEPSLQRGLEHVSAPGPRGLW